jgi:hypothetical protein
MAVSLPKQKPSRKNGRVLGLFNLQAKVNLLKKIEKTILPYCTI